MQHRMQRSSPTEAHNPPNLHVGLASVHEAAREGAERAQG